jgi:hypothetical protein
MDGPTMVMRSESGARSQHHPSVSTGSPGEPTVEPGDDA